jgi:hypothetical protein
MIWDKPIPTYAEEGIERIRTFDCPDNFITAVHEVEPDNELKDKRGLIISPNMLYAAKIVKNHLYTADAIRITNFPVVTNSFSKIQSFKAYDVLVILSVFGDLSEGFRNTSESLLQRLIGLRHGSGKITILCGDIKYLQSIFRASHFLTYGSITEEQMSRIIREVFAEDKEETIDRKKKASKNGKISKGVSGQQSVPIQEDDQWLDQ